MTVGMYIKETISGGGCNAVEGETEYEIDGHGPGHGGSRLLRKMPTVNVHSSLISPSGMKLRVNLRGLGDCV